jgi:hypothetical protein
VVYSANITVKSRQSPTKHLLAHIQKVCGRFQIGYPARQIEFYNHLCRQDQLIDVAVLGQFKAGESSSLNSLTRTPIPLVAVIHLPRPLPADNTGRESRPLSVLLAGHRSKWVWLPLLNSPQKQKIQPTRKMQM